jgi:hypothetical protein
MAIPTQLPLFPELEIVVDVTFPLLPWLFIPFDLKDFLLLWNGPEAL